VSKVGIVGESAGGHAVMQVLYLYPDIWTVGMSIYGISSLHEFAEDTHKFESQYVDSLVLATKEGKSEKEIETIYKARIAFYHVEKIKALLLLL
jgi:dipeptidyl aminopeptidase/acylaminoacyl peptidase